MSPGSYHLSTLLTNPSAYYNQHNSRLLRLPAEIRNRILELAMDIDGPAPSLHDEYPLWDRLDVSRTSRQIFAETAHRYFQSKLIFFPNALHELLCIDELELIASEVLTSPQKRAVRHVWLRWDDMCMDWRKGSLDLKVLREFPYVDRITIGRMQRHALENLRGRLSELMRAATGNEGLLVDFRSM
ncbi:hypothetical protein CC86DRAFT_137468 [Ophiobolus disseminans]|uniref:F-box domain-containing protein n=1 Tax=Ophiobolus disseminans TaxID=1469910 RepID=A0A6A7AF28_9PLEO|nr:hypothetical protein CC86DRAFT_137468 [Ophiobolus disseminans]